MNKQTQNIILGTGAIFTIGVATFLFTRKAAAKSKAEAAFVVDQDCGSFLVVDEAKAKGALIAATIAVAPSPDSDALGALKGILTFMFPQCDWSDPPAGRMFVNGAQSLKWVDIENAISGKTVAELKDMLIDAGVMQGESAIATPWLIKDVFGTGGCLSCMGTGGFGTGVTVYRQHDSTPYDPWGRPIRLDRRRNAHVHYKGPYSRYVRAYRGGAPIYMIGTGGGLPGDERTCGLGTGAPQTATTRSPRVGQIKRRRL